MKSPLLLLLAVLAALPHRAAAREAPDPAIPADRLPLLWKPGETVVVPREQRDAVGKRLGVHLSALTNTPYDAGGLPVRVNVARCADAKEAADLAATFVRIHGGDPLYADRRGDEAAEIVCGNRAVAQAARAALGWSDPPRARWKVTFAAAPLESGPPMRWNRLFNLLLALRADPSEENLAAAAAGAEGFAFGRSLRLRAPGWTCRPAPARIDPIPDGVRLIFDDLPRTAGIPMAEVEGTVPVEAFRPRPASKGEDLAPLRAATAAWPAEDPAVKAIAAGALEGFEGPPRRRLERILGAVRSRIRFGGEETGSRWGVKALLARGEGHCWDFSDLLVALCRAAGIPARQVGGWLHGGEGHVWAEAWVEGEGWWPVDATTSWIGVSEDYVPIWSSDEGRRRSSTVRCRPSSRRGGSGGPPGHRAATLPGRMGSSGGTLWEVLDQIPRTYAPTIRLRSSTEPNLGAWESARIGMVLG